MNYRGRTLAAMASASLWRPPMAGRAVKVPRHATTWPGNARTCTPRARRPTAPSMAAVQLEPTCRPQRFLSTEQHELAEVSVRKLSAVAVGLQEGSNKQAGGLVVHRVGQVQPGGSCQRNFWPALSAPAPRWRHAAASAGTPTGAATHPRMSEMAHLCICVTLRTVCAAKLSVRPAG